MINHLITRVGAKLTKSVSARAATQTAILQKSLQDVRLAIGHAEARAVRNLPSDKPLRDAEFRVFSQFGEDGIIQFLLRHVGAVPEVFVEIGVENYTEANTAFLLENDNWRGLIIDGSAAAMDSVRRRNVYWRHDLTAIAEFITRDNVNDLIVNCGFTGEIGLLSIDIDGNDYWVWERLSCVSPVIVVAEYNSVFGPARAVSVPYDADFHRSAAHYSNLLWGCSLKALCHLAGQKGYAFVGTNSNGNNAFFVRHDRAARFRQLSADEGYVESRIRESRDEHGNLTFLRGKERLKAIAHLQLVDVVTGSSCLARELL